MSQQLFFDFQNNPYNLNNLVIGDFNHHTVHTLLLKPILNHNIIILKADYGCGKTFITSIYHQLYEAQPLNLNQYLNIDNIYNSINQASTQYFFLENIDHYQEHDTSLLLEILNNIIINNYILLLTTTTPLNFPLKDLQSRLNAALYLSIDPPNLADKKMIFLKMLNDKKIYINQKLINFILNNQLYNCHQLNQIACKLYELTMQYKIVPSKRTIKDEILPYIN